MEGTAFQQLREALLLYDTEPTRFTAGSTTNHRQPRVRIGSLKDMHTLPLDLLFEVCVSSSTHVDATY